MDRAQTIAVVDDDSAVRHSIEKLLCSLGYNTVGFGSAEDFLGSDHLGDISCVITDMKMPGMNGVELQSCLISEGLRMPVIFMTAFPEERTRARAVEAGAYGFLTKPFRQEHLIDCLRSALRT